MRWPREAPLPASSSSTTAGSRWVGGQGWAEARGKAYNLLQNLGARAAVRCPTNPALAGRSSRLTAHPSANLRSPPLPADVDPQYKSDAEQGVLRRYLSTAPGELEHRLAVGRLLAGGANRYSMSWLNTIGPEFQFHSACCTRLQALSGLDSCCLPSHLAGEDLQAVEPLRVMELLSRRASASGSLDPGMVSRGGKPAWIAAPVGGAR